MEKAKTPTLWVRRRHDERHSGFRLVTLSNRRATVEFAEEYLAGPIPVMKKKQSGWRNTWSS
jgi:hypothetical protein